MNPTLKWIAIGCAGLLIVGVAAIAVMAWFVKTKGPAIAERANAAHTDGAAFGQKSSESQCFNEAMSRYRRDPGIISGTAQSVWLQACFEPSTVDPQFCADVPAMEDGMRKSIEWRVARCKQLGLGSDSVCQSILSQVQQYCTSSSRRDKVSAAAQKQ